MAPWVFALGLVPSSSNVVTVIALDTPVGSHELLINQFCHSANQWRGVSVIQSFINHLSHQ